MKEGPRIAPSLFIAREADDILRRNDNLKRVRVDGITIGCTAELCIYLHYLHEYMLHKWSGLEEKEKNASIIRAGRERINSRDEWIFIME